MDTQSYSFTEAEVALAASQEEAESLSAENEVLKQRVVLLRALVNRLQTEVSEAELSHPFLEEDLELQTEETA